MSKRMFLAVLVAVIQAVTVNALMEMNKQKIGNNMYSETLKEKW